MIITEFMEYECQHLYSDLEVWFDRQSESVVFVNPTTKKIVPPSEVPTEDDFMRDFQQEADFDRIRDNMKEMTDFF